MQMFKALLDFIIYNFPHLEAIFILAVFIYVLLFFNVLFRGVIDT